MPFYNDDTPPVGSDRTWTGEWHVQVVRDVPEAERLLERLRAEGVAHRRLSVAGDLVVVRWL